MEAQAVDGVELDQATQLVEAASQLDAMDADGGRGQADDGSVAPPVADPADRTSDRSGWPRIARPPSIDDRPVSTLRSPARVGAVRRRPSERATGRRRPGSTGRTSRWRWPCSERSRCTVLPEVHQGLGARARRLPRHASRGCVQRGLGDGPLAGPTDGTVEPALDGVRGTPGPGFGTGRIGPPSPVTWPARPRIDGGHRLGTIPGLAASEDPDRWEAALTSSVGAPSKGSAPLTGHSSTDGADPSRLPWST